MDNLQELKNKIEQLTNNTTDEKISEIKSIFEQLLILLENQNKTKKSTEKRIKENTKKISGINHYLDSIDDSLDSYDKMIKDLGNDSELLLAALINVKKNFDTYVDLQAKERIMNTAIITVLTIELFSNGIIDNTKYTEMLKNIINQILEAYKNAGCSIDFTQELQSLDSIDSNVLAIHMPSIISTNGTVSTVTTTAKEQDDEEPNNIINFNSVLKKKTNTQKQQSTSQELYDMFASKFDKAFKKKNDKDKNDNDKKGKK